MKIIIAQNIGFCFGVERAYKLSLKALNESQGKCQMLGNLVHNEKVINDLKKKGLEFISSVDQAESGTVIIRAHGVADKTIKELEKKEVVVVDATCLLVKKAQDFARQLFKEKRKVIIIGEKDHAEVRAINGAIDNQGLVIESAEEIESIPRDKPIGIVIQTTQDAQKTKFFLEKIKQEFKDIIVHETFCHAVSKRQDEVRELASKTDFVLVVGSKTSANTQRLVEIVSSQNKRVYGIQDKKDIKKEWFNKEAKVGLISGTSAPGWIINQIIQKLNEIKEEYDKKKN
jgi:(E)-4-hydroxy-3-methyl-but-2-enyl pyrophosphate reductase